MKAIALIGRDVREVDALPAAPKPMPPPRSTYRGPSGDIEQAEQAHWELMRLRATYDKQEYDDANKNMA